MKQRVNVVPAGETSPHFVREFDLRRKGWGRAIGSAFAALALLSVIGSPSVQADQTAYCSGTPGKDASSIPNLTASPNMTGVNDVLCGQTTVLQQSDAALLVSSGVPNQNNNLVYDYTTVLNPLTTENSTYTQQSPVTMAKYSLAGPVGSNSQYSASASGRMFNNGNDVVVTVSMGGADRFDPVWVYSYFNPANKVTKGPYTLNMDLDPNTNPFTPKVVMGDFQGTHLKCPLIFVETQYPGYVLWGLNIVPATDINEVDSIDPTGGPVKGVFYSHDTPSGSPFPIVSSVVAGDFNGDGVDEIAVLLSDGQTIQLFNVDPKSLHITPGATITLPAPIRSGTLAAGRFGSGPNVVLAAVGAQMNSLQLIIDYVDPLNTSKKVYSTVLSVPGLNSSVYGGVFAQAAPIINWSSTSVEQLVIGAFFYYDSYHNILIGTFDPNYNFNLQGNQQDNGCLFGMQVGNFNNTVSDGTNNYTPENPNPNWQIALFKSYRKGSQCGPPYGNGYVHMQVNSVTVPDSIKTSPQSPVINGQQMNLSITSEQIPNMGPYSTIQSATLITGDFQGRSVRLGAPEVITLYSHIQPTFVLGVPPMHVDWVRPLFSVPSTLCEESNAATTEACTLNLTARTYGQSTDQNASFFSSFSSSQTASTQTNDTSLSSWSAAVKDTGSIKYKMGDGETAVSASLKNTLAYTFNYVHNTVDSYYAGKTTSLTDVTAFDDFVYYTSENQNIFHYPILGQTTSDGKQVYIVYSVPSQTSTSSVNAASQEWYQPVEEPGNVLSYPASQQLLAQEFSLETVTPKANSNCTTVTSGPFSQGVSWNGSHANNTVTGISHKISDNLQLSASLKVGDVVEGVGAQGTIKASLDVSGSHGWGSLNQTISTSTSSQAVSFHVPQFESAATFNYSFTNFVFGVAQPEGLQNTNDLFKNAPNKIPPDQYVSGPLFAKFTADPLHQCASGGANFWTSTYQRPDVGFNHPSRWTISSSNIASFNQAVTPSAANPLIDQAFYHMKGLFITTKADPGDNRVPSSTIQGVAAGQTVTLSARVYNFSLVDTNSVSGSSVHVRFYGQKICPNVPYNDPSKPGQTITVKDLCPGTAFQIGSDSSFSNIPAASRDDVPNYMLASVDFDTTGYDHSDLVFWVVSSLEDADGNVLREMPDHGLTMDTFTGTSISDITDIGLEAHSNNVGMYGVYTPFHVSASETPAPQLFAASARLTAAARPVDHPLGSIAMSLPARNIPVDQKSKVHTTFAAASTFGGSKVFYFDGDPRRGGKLFDVQSLHELAAGEASTERVFFRPQHCGPHTLFAVSKVEGFRETLGSVSAMVTIDPVSEIDKMIALVQGLHVQKFLEAPLTANLRTAQARFKAGNIAEGISTLRVFQDLARLIPARNGNHLLHRSESLISEARLITTCEHEMRAQFSTSSPR